jgi:hypothetical protein
MQASSVQVEQWLVPNFCPTSFLYVVDPSIINTTTTTTTSAHISLSHVLREVSLLLLVFFFETCSWTPFCLLSYNLLKTKKFVFLLFLKVTTSSFVSTQLLFKK